MPITRKVALEHAPPNDKLYGNPIFGIQVTGNSNSIRAFWKPLRQAGAAARAMLVQAAAQQWQVDPASCSASNGTVTHAASGRTLAYGDLADAAGAVPVPQDPPLKDPKDFTLIGKPLKRFDTPSKVNGTAIYGIDAMLPGMKFATIAACPVFGGKVATCRRQRGQGRPGRAAGRRARRSGCRRRRSHVGRQEGSRRSRHHLGRRAERQDQFGRHLGGLARREQEGRRRREIRGRHRQRPDAGRAVRRRIRIAVPRACDHGADELHGSGDAGCLRNLDRHSGHHARAAGGGRSRGSADREGDRAQSLAWRRFRPAARSRTWPRAPCALPNTSTGR